MPEYIEREKVLKTLEEIKSEKEKEFEKRKIFIEGLTTVFNELCAIKSVIRIIKKDIPASDVQPVVHAAWGMKNNIKMNDRLGRAYRIAEPTFTCTNCRKVYSHVSPYCPNCGAKMDGAQNIETCICCGEIIPEGRQVCPKCEKGEMHDKV